MRRLIVLASLLSVMLGLKIFLGEIDDSSTSPLTLAAIGFVVLAAFTVGELVTFVGVPKITGYILSGVVLGPGVSSLVSQKIVQEMGVFNTLALGLIALTAGLELDLIATRKVFRTILATVAAKVPLLLALVGGTFWAIETYHPFLALPTEGAVLGLALIFAVLCIGTSPAISLAVINDSQSKGPLADLTLAIAVVKDLVVVVLLAVAIVLARGFLDAGSHLGSASLLTVGVELAGSILLGALIGAALILYVKLFGKHMLLALVAVVLLTAEASHALHLELLLVLITAGFVVRNFSDFEHTLLTPLNRVSLPVFVVFFTTTGAGVDLVGTWKLMPLALALAAARALAYYLASAFGTRIGRQTVAVKQNAWLAFIPQAGVTLGLVLLAARQFPSLAAVITSTGLALVSVNLLVGPITLAFALRRAQALLTLEGATVPPTGSSVATSHAIVPQPTPSVPTEPPPGPCDPETATVWFNTREELSQKLREFCKEKLFPRGTKTKLVARRTFADRNDDESVPAAMVRLLHADHLTSAELWLKELDGLETSLVEIVEALPLELSVPLEARNFRSSEGDFVETKLAKSAGRMLFAIGLFPIHRRIPLRLVMRFSFEPQLASLVTTLGESLLDFERRVLMTLRALAQGQMQAEACQRRLDEIEIDWQQSTYRTIEGHFEQSAAIGVPHLDRVGGPGYPIADLRLSTQLSTIASFHRKRTQGLPRWQKIVSNALDGVKARAAVAMAAERFRTAVERNYGSPLDLAHTEILPLVSGVLDQVGSLRTSLALGQDLVAADVLIGSLDELLGKRERNRLRGLKVKYRHATQVSEFLAECAQLLERLPRKLYPLRDDVKIAGSLNDMDIHTETMDVSALVQELVVERFVPRFSERLASASEIISDIDDRLGTTLAMAALSLRGYEKSDALVPDAEVRLAFLAILDRTYGQIDQIKDELVQSVRDARERLDETLAQALDTLAGLLDQPQGARVRISASVGQTQRALRKALSALRVKFRKTIRRLLAAVLRTARRRNVPGWLFDSRPDDMDPSQILATILTTFKAPEALGLPPACLGAFSAEPIDDVRLITARKQALEELIVHVQKGRGEGSGNVLICGSRGSGRTSAINIVELRLARQRVLRLDPRFHSRKNGIFSALAAELGCLDEEQAMFEAMQKQHPVVLIDDFQHYVLPTPAGLKELERFAQLMVRSTAKFVVTIERTALALLQETIDITTSFGRRFYLAPLEANELRRCVEARARQGGITLNYAPNSARKSTQEGAAASYYQFLATATHGNLRHVLLTHLRGLRHEKAECFSVQMEPRTSLPLLAGLGTDAIAALGLFITYGALSLSDLAALMLVDESATARFIGPLQDAGLLRRTAHGQAFSVAPHIDGALQSGLEKLGILANELAA